MYLEKNKLASAIKQFNIDNVLTNELHFYCHKIIRGVITRYTRELDEDMYQDCWIKLLGLLPNIKTDQNCFGYLTTCLINEVRYRHRKKRRPYSFSELDGDFLEQLGL